MAENGSNQSIIIKKVKKGGHAAHGGAWKIAYADFVTAMMAFFLLLWLLNSVTQEQLEGISNYFAPVAASSTTSGAGDVLGGKTIAVDGAMTDQSSRPSTTMDLPPPKAGSGLSDAEGSAAPDDISDQQAEELLKKKEEEQFQEASEALKKAIESVPSLKNLADSLLIDDTPEGLRIQIVDQEGLAMFPSGSAEMYLHTKKVLELVAKVIETMPQKISISGHTDATKFAGGETGYGNWELSADRANAARRYLIHRGVTADRVQRVVGKAATDPLLPDEPTHASNRRLSIILLRGTGQQELKKSDLPGLEKATSGISVSEPAPAPAPAPADGPRGQSIPMTPKAPSLEPEPAPEPETSSEPPQSAPQAKSEPVPAPVIAPAPAPAPKANGSGARREIVIPLGPSKPKGN